MTDTNRLSLRAVPAHAFYDFIGQQPTMLARAVPAPVMPSDSPHPSAGWRIEFTNTVTGEMEATSRCFPPRHLDHHPLGTVVYAIRCTEDDQDRAWESANPIPLFQQSPPVVG